MSRIVASSRIAVALSCLLSSTGAWAQDASTSPAQWSAPSAPDKDRGPETLFGDGRSPVLGGYGGVGVMYSRVDQTNVALMCGQGALLLDHAFSVGLGGCGVANRLDGSAYTGVADDRMDVGYGGLVLRYHFLARQMVNVSLGSMIGGGGVSFGKWDDGWEDRNDERTHDMFFMVEPQATVDLNVTRWFRAGIGGGYRIASGTNTTGLDNTDLSGPTAGAHLLFGWF